MHVRLLMYKLSLFYLSAFFMLTMPFNIKCFNIKYILYPYQRAILLLVLKEKFVTNESQHGTFAKLMKCALMIKPTKTSNASTKRAHPLNINTNFTLPNKLKQFKMATQNSKPLKLFRYRICLSQGYSLLPEFPTLLVQIFVNCPTPHCCFPTLIRRGCPSTAQVNTKDFKSLFQKFPSNISEYNCGKSVSNLRPEEKLTDKVWMFRPRNIESCTELHKSRLTLL